MSKRRLGAVVAGSLAFLLAAPAGARPVSTSEAALLAAINATRTSHGVPPLHRDVRLVRIARSHTVDMLRRDYFSHGSFATRMRASGAPGPAFGENLAWSTAATSQSIVGGWLGSPPHRAILLRSGFRRIGIGVATGTFHGYSGATVVTADFAGS